MSNPRVTKQQAELAIFDRFVKAYSRHFGTTLEKIKHRDKPDFSAVDAGTGQTIGVEVTGVYQDEREAKINYWLSGTWGKIEGNVEGLISSINRSMVEKAAKAISYQNVGPLILAMWIGSFIFKTRSDIKYFEHDLIIPKNPFSLIVLILKDENYQDPVFHILQQVPGWRK